LHLDIKPANIYIRNDGTPVLIDFGAARQTLAQEGPRLSRMYTPGCPPPEQYQNRDLLGPWSDCYAIGASIFACLANAAPQAADDRTSYAYTRDSLLMVGADGMGGHLHGEVASQIAAQLLTEAFQREAKPKLADPSAFLQKSITDAHFALGDSAKARDLIESPRTTCVACVVQDSTAYWAHAGDSRPYHIRQGRIQAQTRDHSRVQLH